jgi:hypothetical protein
MFVTAASFLVKYMGVADLQVGDDEACAGPFRAGLHTGDDPLDAAPAGGCPGARCGSSRSFSQLALGSWGESIQSFHSVTHVSFSPGAACFIIGEGARAIDSSTIA